MTILNNNLNCSLQVLITMRPLITTTSLGFAKKDTVEYLQFKLNAKIDDWYIENEATKSFQELELYGLEQALYKSASINKLSLAHTLLNQKYENHKQQIIDLTTKLKVLHKARIELVSNIVENWNVPTIQFYDSMLPNGDLTTEMYLVPVFTNIINVNNHVIGKYRDKSFNLYPATQEQVQCVQPLEISMLYHLVLG